MRLFVALSSGGSAGDVGQMKKKSKSDVEKLVKSKAKAASKPSRSSAVVETEAGDSNVRELDSRISKATMVEYVQGH